jgi:RNA-directed DNA polymerase
VNWILDADIRDFFGSVSQEWLLRLVEHRSGDKRVVRLIRKWLRAGVLEDGTVTVSDRGTGQGSVISPLLANIYLPALRPRPVGRALATARGHRRHDHRPLCR